MVLRNKWFAEQGDALENMSSLKHLHMSLDEESGANKSVTGLVSSIRSLSSLVLFLNTSLSQQLHVPLPDKLCRFIFLSPAESTARAGGLTITADALQVKIVDDALQVTNPADVFQVNTAVDILQVKIAVDHF